MFELIMAGRLAGARFRPSFNKGPDVQVEFATLQLAIQCKRPFSASGLEENIKKAIRQLKGGKAELNIVAVSVSRLLNSGDPYSIPEVPHHELGHPYVEARIHEIAQQSQRFWFNKLDRSGILFYTFTPIRSSEEPQYFFDRCENLFPISPDELTSTLLISFSQSLNR
ncbi:MAG: hypothetical protein M3Y27_18335 [Acidobacteriota bacterium]|nr:hypothetical protein [Acidobacteriota bacterium]